VREAPTSVAVVRRTKIQNGSFTGIRGNTSVPTAR